MPLCGATGLVASLFAASALTTLHRLPAAAQGGNVDIISGTVTDRAGKPVPNAQIEGLSIETDVTRRTQTDTKGHYILFFNDGGGEYRITARAIGHNPFIQNVSRQPDDDRISLDIQLGTQAVRLQDLVANVNRRPDLSGNDMLADSSAAIMQPHIDSLTSEVDRVRQAKTSADVVPLLTRIRAFTVTAVREQRAVDSLVRTALTEVQWALLPDYVRNPTNNLFGMGGGPAGRGGAGGRRGTGGAGSDRD